MLMCNAGTVCAVEYVSVGERSALLYDAPSTKASKLFVVSQFMPLERVVTLSEWIKVRDRSGGLYWVEKSALSSRRFVVAINPLVDVRAEPDSGSTRLFQVRQDVALELIESSGQGWVKIRHQDGEVGFVRSVEVWGE